MEDLVRRGHNRHTTMDHTVLVRRFPAEDGLGLMGLGRNSKRCDIVVD